MATPCDDWFGVVLATDETSEGNVFVIRVGVGLLVNILLGSFGQLVKLPAGKICGRD